MNFFRKYHKWLGVILTFFILIFAVSGIVLNHRKAFSGADISRKLLPADYRYLNWNNAAVKGTVKVSPDSVLMYGNLGVWLTDSTFITFKNLNNGFGKGADHYKIFKICIVNDSIWLAGTQFGLFQFNFATALWERIPAISETVMDLATKGDTILVLTRSHLYVSQNLKHFEKITLPPPPNYRQNASLFKTLWTIHSGEIIGHAGVLFVDFIGLVFIFLSITGLIYFFAPNITKRYKAKAKSIANVVKINRFSLKWHNKLGYWLIGFLIISTLTGMFLRPPLLITIYNAQVGQIPYTKLATPNAWNDKLRRIIYNKAQNEYLIATLDGIYTLDADLKQPMQPANGQPPVSVMGVNVFEEFDTDTYLIGSFEGLFLWHKPTGQIYDAIDMKPFEPTSRGSSPIGQHLVAGYSFDYFKGPLYFDYNNGLQPLANFNVNVPMPEDVKNSPMSLWNLALEFHTMRIFSVIIGPFYILLIPLLGIGISFILVSGLVVYLRYHRKIKTQAKQNLA